MRRILVSIALLAIAACGTERTSLLPSAPLPAAPVGERITAKTAVVLLRSKIDFGDRRLLMIASDDAPRGYASQWRVTTVSIVENDIATFLVGANGPSGAPSSEAYNPVFNTQNPPFTEEGWAADSSDAARTLAVPENARIMLLEADDEGILHWSVILADMSGVELVAGKTGLDTPLPTGIQKVRRH